MIENEKQYNITKTKIQEIEAILLNKKSRNLTDLHTEAAIVSLIRIKNKMESEIEAYEKICLSRPRL